VRILQLVERGVIGPDMPVSQVLPQFTGEKGTMTPLQMFSHTAGYGDDSGDPLLFDRNITLAQAVDEIACCRPLNPGYSVGGQFSYGGVSMHVAGRMAEVAGGIDWQLGWQQQLGQPLGITTIDWQAFGATTNYGIAGSARSNLRDYGRVVHMLANRGRGNSRQILRPETVDLLTANRVGSLPIASAPPNVQPPVRYGLGSWLDGARDASRPPLIHSLGAFGYFPWVDFESGVYGVFMIRGGAGINAASIPAYNEMLASIASTLQTGNCGWVERFDEVFVHSME
jgi:CubicO group peptidase (beta-lactamase class C family)